MNILIADDSKGSRDVLRYLIVKQVQANISEAGNGIDALSIMKSMPTDILITDIKMPQMDGIELIEHAKKLNPEIQIIVFSAFGNFEFAKKVLQFGVINYLLKPINVEEFSKTLTKVTDNYKNMLKKLSVKQFDETVLSKLAEEKPLPEPLSNYSALIFLQAKASVNAEIPEKYFENLKCEYLLKGCKNGFYILIDKKEGLTENELSEFYNTLADELEVYICCARFENSSYSLYRAYHGVTDEMRENRFFEKPYGSYTININAEKPFNDISFIYEQARKAGKLAAQNPENIEVEIDALIKQIHENAVSSKQCKYIFTEFIKQLFINGGSSGIHDTAVERINSAEYLSSIKSCIKLTLSELSEKQSYSTNDSSASPIIQTALEIIRNEYMYDINRTTVANRIYISSAYFSHLFKKETGKNFSQYLNEYRMNRACTLLRSSTYNIYSIAKMVGFTNYPYFCSQFKKQYGQTCIQYRETHFKEGE